MDVNDLTQKLATVLQALEEQRALAVADYVRVLVRATLAEELGGPVAEPAVVPDPRPTNVVRFIPGPAYIPDDDLPRRGNKPGTLIQRVTASPSRRLGWSGAARARALARQNIRPEAIATQLSVHIHSVEAALAGKTYVRRRQNRNNRRGGNLSDDELRALAADYLAGREMVESVMDRWKVGGSTVDRALRLVGKTRLDRKVARGDCLA